MRLFHAQNVLDDASPTPLPPFSIEREVTSILPVYLNQYRDDLRLPTPEKVAVMELSTSFERRRLGKHQRVLNDISERCRVQEIHDLSNKLSAKVKLQRLGQRQRETTFYTTTFMGNKGPPPSEIGDDNLDNLASSKPKIFVKNYKQFPARRVMKHQTKFEFLRQGTMLPRLAPTPQNVTHSAPDDFTSMRRRLAEWRQINGTIQLNHYNTPRPDLAPLILPNIEYHHTRIPGIETERLQREQTSFSAFKLNLGPRSKTQMTMDNNNTSPRKPARENDIVPLPTAALRLGTYGHELSQLQLTSGHSPPPNSVQEIETLAS